VIKFRSTTLDYFSGRRKDAARGAKNSRHTAPSVTSTVRSGVRYRPACRKGSRQPTRLSRDAERSLCAQADFLGVLSLRGGSTSASAPDRPPEPLLRGAPADRHRTASATLEVVGALNVPPGPAVPDLVSVHDIVVGAYVEGWSVLS
jgi:hypothetical protein